jgi:hypothetical protein
MTIPELRLKHMLRQIGQYRAFHVDEDCSICDAARSAVQISRLERLRKENFCLVELGAWNFIGLEDAEAGGYGVLRRDGGDDVADHIC